MSLDVRTAVARREGARVTLAVPAPGHAQELEVGLDSLDRCEELREAVGLAVPREGSVGVSFEREQRPGASAAE